eukprot:g4837.t1
MVRSVVGGVATNAGIPVMWAVVAVCASGSGFEHFPDTLDFQPAGSSTLQIALDGRASVSAANLERFRVGLAGALAVARASVAMGGATSTAARRGGESGLVVTAHVAARDEAARDALRRRVQRVGFDQSLVASLRTASFPVRAQDLHTLPYISYQRVSPCIGARDCRSCAKLQRCAWCGSAGRCLDGDNGVCDRDEWDTKQCQRDRAAAAATGDEASRASGGGGGGEKPARRVGMLLGLVTVIGSALLLVGLHHQLRGLISTSRRGAGEDADLDFEQIEEQLELAELDAEEAAYSKEEAGALLNIY